MLPYPAFLPTNLILPWRTNMGPIWVPYGIHGSHMGKTRWGPDGPYGANGIWVPYGASGPHVGPSGYHMVSPYGTHMVGEFCPHGTQMGPIFFATWVLIISGQKLPKTGGWSTDDPIGDSTGRLTSLTLCISYFIVWYYVFSIQWEVLNQIIYYCKALGSAK